MSDEEIEIPEVGLPYLTEAVDINRAARRRLGLRGPVGGEHRGTPPLRRAGRRAMAVVAGSGSRPNRRTRKAIAVFKREYFKATGEELQA